jgi:integrase
MDDDSMALPNHVTCRDGVYQYVRRIPDEIADAFAKSRIQLSLRTRLPSEARLRAAKLDEDIERQFAEARRGKGISFEFMPTAGWTWDDWSKVVSWLKAHWLHEDRLARLDDVTGAHFSLDYRGRAPWLPDKRLREQIGLRKLLSKKDVTGYAAERGAFLARSLGKIGILPPHADPYRYEFMAACLKAEIESLELVFKREGGEQVDHPHPDTIKGPWTVSQVSSEGSIPSSPKPDALFASTALVQTKIVESAGGSQTLSHCIDEWIKERIRLRKKVDSHLVNDMRSTVVWFTKFTKVSTVTEVRRRHIIAFRDHLFDKGTYKAATINKKVGYLTTMMSLSAGKGWVESAIEGGIYIEIPSDEDKRDSYSPEELTTLFASPTFTLGRRSAAVKAGGDLQYWLPLISCCHGLISSEILQLGPDTILQHPDSDVWCFRVTNAGGRSIKAFSRERYVPIRAELIDIGLLALAEKARRKGWSTIWEAMEQPGRTVSNVSTYFSAYWSAFAKKQLGEAPVRKSLYSFRHSFKDELDRTKVTLEIKQALLGHSDIGTTGRYGTKSRPRRVDIAMLRKTIDSLDWNFLSELKRP